MATITITIPNANLATVVAALTPDWTATVVNAQGETVANPVSQNEAARQKVIRLVKTEVKAYKENQATSTAAQAVESARVTAVNEANAINIT